MRGARWLPVLSLIASLAHAQQVPDTTFQPVVASPEWQPDRGPALCLDEGHHNFHTLDGRFRAFGRLASRDGFRVSAFRSSFATRALARCRVLVIANAQPDEREWTAYPTPTPSAFSPAEVRAVARWVAGGGSLLLIADHMPLAGAARALGAAFGFVFVDGFAVARFSGAAGRDSSFARPTLFRRDTGLLRDHVVARGRTATESVQQVRSFTGQAFRDSAGGALPVLQLPADFVSLEPRFAWQFSDSTPERRVGGWLQGATRDVGRGRVAVFGEAAMFSAQVTGAARRPMGMNAPGAEENAQFVVNVLRWLARVL